MRALLVGWHIILFASVLLAGRFDAFAIRVVQPETPCTGDFGGTVSRARYYHPDTGRFWTMDTDEGHQDDPQSLHKYLFCVADPVNKIDPSGNLAEEPLFAGFHNVNVTQRDAARVSTGRTKAMNQPHWKWI